MERGEVLYGERREGKNVVGQTIGLIDGTPEECFAVIRDYDRYGETMPFTDQSTTLRTFRLDGPIDPGSVAVDFWTRVNLGGFTMHYVLRIVHLPDPPEHRYRSYWTLIRNPEQMPYQDTDGKPYANDLATDIGSHLFEPYHGNPARTQHTYTLRPAGRDWRRHLLTIGGSSSMKEVTRRVRRTVEAKHGTLSVHP